MRKDRYDPTNGEVRFLGYSWLSRRISARCGHPARSKGTLLVFGKKSTPHVPFQVKTVDFCLDCLAKMITRCAWCGMPIGPDDPITLYAPRDRDYQAPAGGRAYTFDEAKKAVGEIDPKNYQGNFFYVGCMGWHCTDSGVDRFGFWVAPGEPMKTLSPLEAVLQTGKMVIVSNVGSIPEALQLEYETQKEVLIKQAESNNS